MSYCTFVGNILVEEGLGSKSGAHSHSFESHNAKTLYIGCLLLEWASLNGADLLEVEELALANAHVEVWKSNGVASDPYNLSRSLQIYENAMNSKNSMSIVSDPVVMTQYSRVLQYSGEIQQANQICMKMLTRFESQDDFPKYVLFVGGMLKALGDFDKAGSYFFEAMNIGPPRLFTRLDMMFIVARTLEESTADSDEPVEDGYKMVHHHLISDGFIPDTLTYDEWINDANTWLLVADKCAIVGIFSLAADLYGQGINRDMNAFKKSRLWLGFAKACARCGKNSEAQLALKQALALDPHNVQCKLALEQLADLSAGKFERLLKGSFHDLLEMIPTTMSIEDKAAAKLQGVLRGKALRKEMEVGMGALSVKSASGGGDPSIKTQVLEARQKLVKSLILRLYTVPDEVVSYMTIKMRSNWQLEFKDFVASDVMSGTAVTLEIQKPRLAPCRTSGVPKKYSFELTIANPNTIHTATKSIPPPKEDEEKSPAPLKHARVLDMTYKDKDTKCYYTQLFEFGYMNLNSSSSSSSSSPLSSSLSSDGLVLRRLPYSRVLTSDHTYFIAKGAFEFMNFNYMYTVHNASEESTIKLTKMNNNQVFVFKFQRECFDQNFNIKAMIKLLFKFLYTFSRFERLLHEDHDIALATLPFPNTMQSDVPSTPGFSETNVNGPSGPFKKDENGDEITTVPYKQRTFKELLEESSLTPDSFDASINEIGVSVNQVVSTTGITFKLTAKDARYPIFSHSFETQDGTDRIPLPPPIDYEAKLMEEEAAKEAAKKHHHHHHHHNSHGPSSPTSPDPAPAESARRNTRTPTPPKSRPGSRPSSAKITPRVTPSVAATAAKEMEEETANFKVAPSRAPSKYEGAEVVRIKADKKVDKTRVTTTPNLVTATGNVHRIGKDGMFSVIDVNTESFRPPSQIHLDSLEEVCYSYLLTYLLTYLLMQ